MKRSSEDDRLRLERFLPAPIEDVFSAWTDPGSMARWLSPSGQAEVEADVRVAGRFRVVMVDDDFRIEHSGEYLQIEAPYLLSFTWQSPYTGKDPSLVTVRLIPLGTGTRLILIHERLPCDAVGPHADGWEMIVDRLVDLFDQAFGSTHVKTGQKEPE